MRLFKKLIRDGRGQSLVELALVLPLLIMLVMGSIEFGRALHSYILITNGSWEGARLAIIELNDSLVIDRVNEVTSTLGPGVSTTVERYGGNPNPVVVRVSYKYYLLTPVLSKIVPNPINLTAVTSMKMEK